MDTSSGGSRWFFAVMGGLLAAILILFMLPVINSAANTAIYSNTQAAIEFLTGSGYVVAAPPGLTPGTVPYVNALGALTDEAAFTYNTATNTLTVDNLSTPTGRTATYVVAASDAPDHVKAQADAVCDGTADDVEIQAALDALSAYAGKVRLSEGTFNTAATIVIRTSGVKYISGAGIDDTVLKRVGGVTDPIIAKDAGAAYIAGFNLSDITLNGNATAGNVMNGTLIHSAIYDTVRFCNTTGNTSGFYVDSGTEYVTFYSCWFGDGGNPMRWGVTGDSVSNFRFYNCNVATLFNNGVGFNFNSCTSMYFYNCSVDEANQPLGSAAYAGWQLTGTCSRIYLTNCEAYANVGTARLGSGIDVGASVTQLYVNGFTCANTSGGLDALAVLRCSTGVLTGIHFNNCNSYSQTQMFVFYGNIDTTDGFKNITFTDNYLDATTPFFFTYHQTPMLLQNIQTEMNVNYIGSGEVRTASGTLTGGAANAILFAWHNPEAQDIYIKKVVITITTADADAANIDVGIADDATYTNGGTEFFDDLKGETIQVNDSLVTTEHTQTIWVLCQDSASATDGWVVAKILDNDGSSIVGSYYIEYVGK